MNTRLIRLSLSGGILAFGLFLGLGGTRPVPRPNVDTPVVGPDDAPLSAGLYLNQWLVFSSFQTNRTKGDKNRSTAADLEHDFLRAADMTETSATERKITDFAARTYGRLFNLLHLSPVTPGFRAGVIHTDGDFVDIGDFVKEPGAAVAYGACVVESPSNQALALFTGANDGMKCWVNNAPVVTIESAPGKKKKNAVKYYDRLTLVHLKSGRNLIVVKVTRKARDWGFAARIASLQTGHNLATEYGLAPLLDNRLLKVGDPLNVSYPFCDPSCPVALEVRDDRGKSVLRQSFNLNGRRSVPLGALHQGIYSACLTTPYGETTETFCLGDLNAAIAAIRRRIVSSHASDLIRMHTDAWLYRVQHLCKKENLHPDDPDWQARMLSALGNLDAVLADPTGGYALLKAPDYRIRAFRSAIDGQPHYYNLIVPHGLPRGRKMPLVLMAPGTFEPPRPFLEGRLVAIIGTINKYRAMADRYGCLVAMPGAQGNFAGTDMRDNDLLDVIADVARYYPIDRNRIFGCGACLGGTQTFLLAAHHPDLFAAVGALAPDVDVSGAPRNSFSPTDPVEIIGNLTHVPMFVMHSIGDESPVANSVKFVQMCKSKGLDASLKLMAGGSHRAQTEDFEELLWAFFQGKLRVSSPRELTISTRHLRYGAAYWAKITGIEDPTRLATLHAVVDAPAHVSVHTENVTSYELLRDRMPGSSKAGITVVTDGRPCRPLVKGAALAVQVRRPPAMSPALRQLVRAEGPVANAFASSFLIVVGTGGSEAEREGLRAVGEELRAAWRDDFYVDCRCKTDVQTTTTDTAQHNLILIGNADNNAVYRQMASRLPLHFYSDHTKLAGVDHAGSHQVVEALFPNPRNAARTVVVIGSNSRGAWRIPDGHLWVSGTFDYSFSNTFGALADSGIYGADKGVKVATK